jgi:hypothetical protein
LSLGPRRLPIINTAPSLDQVARDLDVSVHDIIATTNRYPDNPNWWYYEGLHDYNNPLPQVNLYYAAR